MKKHIISTLVIASALALTACEDKPADKPADDKAAATDAKQPDAEKKDEATGEVKEAKADAEDTEKKDDAAEGEEKKEEDAK